MRACALASNDAVNLAIIHAATESGDISLVQCRRSRRRMIFIVFRVTGKIIACRFMREEIGEPHVNQRSLDDENVVSVVRDYRMT